MSERLRGFYEVARKLTPRQLGAITVSGLLMLGACSGGGDSEVPMSQATSQESAVADSLNPTGTDVEVPTICEDVNDQLDVSSVLAQEPKLVGESRINLNLTSSPMIFMEQDISLGVEGARAAADSFVASRGSDMLIIETKELFYNPDSEGEYACVRMEEYKTYAAEFYQALADRGVTAEEVSKSVVFPEIRWGFNYPISMYADLITATYNAMTSVEVYKDAKMGVLVDHDEFAFFGEVTPDQRAKIARIAAENRFRVVVQKFPNDINAFNADGSVREEASLNPRTAKEIADFFSSDTVSINTGIARTEKEDEKGHPISYTDRQIDDYFTEIVKRLTDVEALGIRIDQVSLFAEDKLNTEEAADFSLSDKQIEQVVIWAAGSKIDASVIIFKGQ